MATRQVTTDQIRAITGNARRRGYERLSETELTSLRPDGTHAVESLEQRGLVVRCLARLQVADTPTPLERVIDVRVDDFEALPLLRKKIDFLSDPRSSSDADRITPVQEVVIRALAQSQGIDADEECKTVFGCSLGELSGKAATAFIGYLKSAFDGDDGTIQRDLDLRIGQALCQWKHPGASGEAACCDDCLTMARRVIEMIGKSAGGEGNPE